VPRKRKKLKLDWDMSDVRPQTRAARGGMQALSKTKIKNTEALEIETSIKKLSFRITSRSRYLMFPKIPAEIQGWAHVLISCSKN
jgi:hypothetical protein